MNIKKVSEGTIFVFLLWIMFLLQGLIFCLINEANTDAAEYLSLAVIIITSMFVLFAVFENIDTTWGKLFAVTGYILMVVLMYYDRNIASLDSSDPNGFHYSALQKSYGIGSSDYGGFYTDIISIIYRLFGRQRIIGQYFNALLVVTIIIICSKIFDLLKLDIKWKTVGVAAIAFSPNFLLINSILRREAVIEIMLTCSLYFFIMWYKTQKFKYMVFAVVFDLLGCMFHAGVIAAAIGYILFYISYDTKDKKLKIKASSFVIAAVVLIIFEVLNYYYGDILFGKFQTEKSIEEITAGASVGRGGSGYSINNISTGNFVLDLIVNAPIRMIYYLLSPMPWDWRGIQDIIAFVFSSLFYTLGYIPVIKAIRKNRVSSEKKHLIVALLITMIISFFIFGWGVKNAGTAMRHRDKFIMIYVTMVALSFSVLEKPCNKCNR